jgi:hypothetical protein
MHLLQDTSQPQHARNEQHLDVFVTEPLSTPWRSPIEDYGDKHKEELNYQHAMLDWKVVGFTKLEDFWDRHMYQRSAAALNAETNGGTSTLGLAEWCNGNFLGARHLYPEYYPTKTNDIKYYPYPSRDSSTDYLEKKSHLSSAVHGFTLKNGEPAQAIYLQKTGDGEHMAFHSRFTYFGAKVPYFGMITINDDNVLSNYHALFIPKAVKYSAGLIDYFFRGSLGVSLGARFVNGDLNLGIANTSGTNLSGGSFRLFYDDENSNRTELTGADFVPNYPGSLAAGASIIGHFIPVSNAVNYILVYQGTIGTTGGSASDPVDDGLAIAAKRFTVDNYAVFTSLVGCYGGSVSPGYTEYYTLTDGISATCSGTLTLHSQTPYTWEVDFEFAPANASPYFHHFWGPFGINGSGTLNGDSWAFVNPGNLYKKQFIITTDASHDQVITWTATTFSGTPPSGMQTVVCY